MNGLEGVRQFHKRLWNRQRDWVPRGALSASLRSLAEQGYTLDDVGIMFGVSRERVRQWYERDGIERPHANVIGRIWDDTANKFVSIRSRDLALHKTVIKRRHPRYTFDYWVRTLPSGCWEWTGAERGDGYGGWKKGLAHRFAYVRAKGPVPDGLEIDHVCRNRRCVNPDHLEAVTHAENLRRSPIHPSVINRQKTHCKRGHALTADNLIPGYLPARRCRECHRLHKREYRKRHPGHSTDYMRAYMGRYRAARAKREAELLQLGRLAKKGGFQVA